MTATATRPPRPVRTLAALLAGLCLCLATAAWAADYASLVGQARDLLQEDRIVEALAVAKDAVRANDNDYKGHYYVALAYLGMGRFDEADEAARRARALAPDSARAGVDKLVASIQTGRQGSDIAQAAEAALADGLTGKAVKIYESAWNNGRDKPALGFKAVELYANRLNQPVDAARILRQIKLTSKGEIVADQAARELTKLAEKLRIIAQDYVALAEKQQGKLAQETLHKAVEADPDFVEIYRSLAQISARDGSMNDFVFALNNLARLNDANIERLGNMPRMVYWLRQAEFTVHLHNLIGSSNVDKLIFLLKEKQDAYEKLLKEYNDNLTRYDEHNNNERQKAINASNNAEKCSERCSAKHGGFFGSAAAEQRCSMNCYTSRGYANGDYVGYKTIPKPVAPIKPESILSD